MSKIEEIEEAVAALPENDYRAFRQLFPSRDREKWDRQIEDDAKGERLAFFLDEVSKAKQDGALREFCWRTAPSLASGQVTRTCRLKPDPSQTDVFRFSETTPGTPHSTEKDRRFLVSTRRHRALVVEDGEDVTWVWIGTHESP